MFSALGDVVIGVIKAMGVEVRWMRPVATLVIGSVGVAVAGWIVPATASADPAYEPCPFAVSLLCRFVPIAPELDGDVDLSKQLPAPDPAATTTDGLPPGDVCISGCI